MKRKQIKEPTANNSTLTGEFPAYCLSKAIEEVEVTQSMKRKQIKEPKPTNSLLGEVATYCLSKAYRHYPVRGTVPHKHVSDISYMECSTQLSKVKNRPFCLNKDYTPTHKNFNK